MLRLKDQVALVTGGGGDIGRSICERFLEEGARVAALDINRKSAKASISGRSASDAIALACDVGDAESVRSAFAETVARLGKLTVLVNAAGGSTPQDGRVTEAPVEEFWRAIRLDLFGTFLCCKFGIPEIVKAGAGSVINMASMVALMGVPDRACYSAAKGGVLSLTRSMAVAHAADRVRVNVIAPGITLTARVKAMMDSHGAFTAVAERHLLGLAEPIDVAEMAVYLASPDSRMVTGQVFSVDSGVTIT